MIGADGRSTSAAGFNLSPPISQGGQGLANLNSPSMASSFGGPASFGRQASCPPSSSGSQSLFDPFPTAMNMGNAGPQNTPVAHSQLAQIGSMGSKEFTMMAVEVQRYRDENNMQKAQLYNLQVLLSPNLFCIFNLLFVCGVEFKPNNSAASSGGINPREDGREGS